MPAPPEDAGLPRGGPPTDRQSGALLRLFRVMVEVAGSVQAAASGEQRRPSDSSDGRAGTA